MLLYGDELGRSQQGNNNAYCQDNELTWIDWELNERDQALLTFARRLVELRHEHPNFRRPKFFQDQAIRGEVGGDIRWLGPDGLEMGDESWEHDWVRTIGLWLDGRALPAVAPDGTPVADDSFLLLCNGHHEPVPFTPPNASDIRAIAGDTETVQETGHWDVLIDTARHDDEAVVPHIDGGAAYELAGRSLALLRWHPSEGDDLVRS
jgi:glycogen operon protein